MNITLFTKCLDLQVGEKYFIPLSICSILFMGQAIHPALFSQLTTKLTTLQWGEGLVGEGGEVKKKKALWYPRYLHVLLCCDSVGLLSGCWYTTTDNHLMQRLWDHGFKPSTDCQNYWVATSILCASTGRWNIIINNIKISKTLTYIVLPVHVHVHATPTM